jgi:hypothetical protein
MFRTAPEGTRSFPGTDQIDAKKFFGKIWRIKKTVEILR